MESRRRAELLATLSPEGRATYAVLKAQLARDLDRCFARLEKDVEAAFGDLRPNCSRIPGRDDAERAKEIVAATATAPALSTSLEDAHDAVDNGIAAVAVSAPTPCSTECPSHDAAVPMSMIISSATPNSPTTTCGIVPELATSVVSDKALDVDVAGNTSPTAACLLANLDDCTGNEDSVYMSLTPSISTVASEACSVNPVLGPGASAFSLMPAAALVDNVDVTKLKEIRLPPWPPPGYVIKCKDMIQPLQLDVSSLECEQLMLYTAKNPWPPPFPSESIVERIRSRFEIMLCCYSSQGAELLVFCFTSCGISNLLSTMDIVHISGDWHFLRTEKIEWNATPTVIIFTLGVQSIQLLPIVFKWSCLLCFDIQFLSSCTLDFLLARRAAHIVWKWSCLDNLHCSLGITTLAIPDWVMFNPWPPPELEFLQLIVVDQAMVLQPRGVAEFRPWVTISYVEVQSWFFYSAILVNSTFATEPFLLSGTAQMNVALYCEASLNLVVYCGYPSLNISHTHSWMLIIVGRLLQYCLDADTLLPVISWLSVARFQLFLGLFCVVQGYPSSHGFFTILNGEATVQQCYTCTRVLTVVVRTRWIYHHILRGNTHYSELMKWSFSHSTLQSEFRFCCALVQWKNLWTIRLVSLKSWFQCCRAQRQSLYSYQNFQWIIPWLFSCQRLQMIELTPWRSWELFPCIYVVISCLPGAFHILTSSVVTLKGIYPKCSHYFEVQKMDEVCIMFSTSTILHAGELYWLLGLCSSCDQFLTEDATTIGSQHFEWQIPWFFCPCRAISLNTGLRMQPVCGRCKFYATFLFRSDVTSTVDSVPAIKYNSGMFSLALRHLDDGNNFAAAMLLLDSQLSPDWVFSLPVACVMQCRSQLMPWEIVRLKDDSLTCTTQVLLSWDPGGSIPFIAAATGSNWNSTQLQDSQQIWDPGGCTQHRLEVKPNFKEGGLSATNLPGWSVGRHSWAVACSRARRGGDREEYIPGSQLRETWLGTDRRPRPGSEDRIGPGVCSLLPCSSSP